MTTSYVDASALVKLVLDEPGSTSMRRWYIESDHVVSSIIGVVETRRAVRRYGDQDDRLEAVMRSVDSVDMHPAIVRHAAHVGPVTLRTLDAIHLATALAMGQELDAFVTYDDRLAAAARTLGLPVVRPA